MAVHQARRAGRLNTIVFQVDGHTPAVHHAKACWLSGHSWSSSRLLSSVCSVPGAVICGIHVFVTALFRRIFTGIEQSWHGHMGHTFKAKARLGMMAGEPIDMGLSEQELHPDPLSVE